MGTKSITKNWKNCQPWNNSVITQFLKLKGEMFVDKVIPGAVCRNPDVTSKINPSPWCIVDVNTLREELCDLTEGSKYKLSPNDYIGHTSFIKCFSLRINSVNGIMQSCVIHHLWTEKLGLVDLLKKSSHLVMQIFQD